jgi:exodeoxyribonuclease I
MPNTFLWHDYITFGLDPAIDRPAQFVAIRTDQDLNVIGDPVVLYCKPPVDYLPSPETCLLIGITPQDTLKKGLDEPDFAKRIYEEMIVPGTTVIGFNSMKFDEEVSINLFYRNFLDIYGLEWTNGYSSWDVINMFRVIYTLRPGNDINWPVKRGSKPSITIEQLVKANNLTQNNTKDALSNVFSIIEAVRMIMERRSGFFNFILKNSAIEKTIELLSQDKPLIYFSSTFGQNKNNAALIVPLIAHPNHKNTMICWNLEMNPDLIESMVADMILEKFSLDIDDKTGFVLIHMNKAPCIFNLYSVKKDDIQRLGLDFSLVRVNLLKVKNRIAPIQKAACVIFNSEFVDLFKTADPDQAIYGPFLSTADIHSRNIVAFYNTENLAGLNTKFQDKKLDQLLLRYKGRNYPNTLSNGDKSQWANYLSDRFSDTGLFSYTAYFKELDKLREKHRDDTVKNRILDDLECYAKENIMPLVAAFEEQENERITQELVKAAELSRYRTLFPDSRELNSRVSAKALRTQVEMAIADGKIARIDLKNVTYITEGYADELFSVLVAQHDLDWFIENINLLCQPPYAGNIIKTIATIIVRRLDEPKNIPVTLLFDALMANKKISEIQSEEE